MRNLATILLIAAASASWAQDPVFHYFQSAEPMSMIEVRNAMEAVRQLDQNTYVHHSDDYTLLQVKSTGGVTATQLRATIAAAGIALLADTPGLAAAMGADRPNDGRPVHVLTGNPAEDRARYQAAVATWNAAHPDDQIQVHSEPH